MKLTTDEIKDQIERLKSELEHKGVATATVQDGRLVVFKKDMLLELLKSDSDVIALIIKSEEERTVN